MNWTRVAIAGAALLLAGCQNTDESAKLKTTLNALTAAMLREDPELATSLGLTEAQVGHKFSDRLSDYSAEGADRLVKLSQDYAKQLQAIDKSLLQPNETVTVDVVASALSDFSASGQFGYGIYGDGPPQPYVVTQLSGAYTAVPDFLDTQHQIKSTQDAEDYLLRLVAFARALDQETARINTDAGKNVIPPDFVIDGALKQLSAFAAKKAKDTVLVESLRRRVARIPGVGAGVTADLNSRAVTIVDDLVLPAYRRQIAALRAVRARAPHDAGVWRLPQGDKLYAAALKSWTTSDMTADQIHQRGAQLVQSLDAEMDAILKAQGMTRGTLAERLLVLSRRRDQAYPNTDAGRAQVMRDVGAQIAALQPALPNYFGVLAKAQLEIKRVPAYIQAGAPGAYYQPAAIDGSRPGAYYVNLRDPRENPRFTLPTVTYHEGVPGHHWQVSIAQEATGLPFIRSAILGFSGYQEGWGLYAEQLADEMGVYGAAPLNRVGYLQSMAFRAARMVVDTGMHTKKWSREQAINFMIETTGMEPSAIAAEVERYAVWPGQACAYMVGRETINRLRDEAKAALGVKFDIRKFHDVVLTNGAMPLSVLEAVVRTWIAEQKNA